MSIISAIKRTIGQESSGADNEWECQDCGNVFRTHSEQSHFVACQECGSSDVERTED